MPHPVCARASLSLISLALGACALINPSPAPAPAPVVAPPVAEAIPEPAPQAAPAPPPPKPKVARRKPTPVHKRDGPGDQPPESLALVPDAQPRREPLSAYANRPYLLFGTRFTPMTTLSGFHQQGKASWYGQLFHGRKTANGERYNMYAMTAAHPTLPIPSYARVTNTDTGQSVIVRVNDRGPYLYGRQIDLSYAAASRLGIVDNGTGNVDIVSIAFDDAGTTPLPDSLASAGLNAGRNLSVKTALVKGVVFSREAPAKGAGGASATVADVMSENGAAARAMRADELLASVGAGESVVDATVGVGSGLSGGSAAIGSMSGDNAETANDAAGEPAGTSTGNSAIAEPAPSWYIPVGTFVSRSSADMLRLQLADIDGLNGAPSMIWQSGGRPDGLYRVALGPYQDQARAGADLKALRNALSNEQASRIAE